MAALAHQWGRRDKVTMDFYAAEPGPMMVAGPTVSAGVRGMVEAHGIGFHPEHQVKSIDPRARRSKREPRRFEGEGMCFIEAGGGPAGMGRGNFHAEPVPDVGLHQPGLLWHGAKVFYEKYRLFTKF